MPKDPPGCDPGAKVQRADAPEDAFNTSSSANRVLAVRAVGYVNRNRTQSQFETSVQHCLAPYLGFRNAASMRCVQSECPVNLDGIPGDI